MKTAQTPEVARAGRPADGVHVATGLAADSAMATTPVNADHLPNRWLIAAAAVVMQICLGAAYGLERVRRAPGRVDRHWTLTQVSLTFTLAIAFLGVGTIIGGLWQDRVGPRPVARIAGVLYGSATCSPGTSRAPLAGGMYFELRAASAASAWGWATSRRSRR